MGIEIGLVSSLNGLGHARRLAYLGQKLSDHGFQIVFFAHKAQISKLTFESELLTNFNKLVEIDYFGVDGPVWFYRGCRVSLPSDEIKSLIKNCDFIISDNSLWPIEYNSAFALFGHFDWVNYWLKSVEQGISFPNLNLLNYELELLKKVPVYFQNYQFKFNSAIYTPNNLVDIKLMRYPNDRKIAINHNRLNVWVSSGTTGLHDRSIANYLKSLKVSLIFKESYKLASEVDKPNLILGRAGLGTIRDCLAFGIPFLPLDFNLDPELTSNIENLGRMLPEISPILSNLSFTSEADLVIFSRSVEKKMDGIWENCSTNIESIISKILDYFNYTLR